MNKKILLTGGLGYIGSHTALKLLEDGYEVIIVDNLSNSFRDALDNIEKVSGKEVNFCKCDISEPGDNGLNDIFNHYDIHAVIHFAAYKSVSQSLKNPISYYSNNVGSTLTLLNKMKRYNVKNMVFSSSCVVYGEPKIYPVTELTPLGESKNPYGESKKMCEKILKDSCENLGINVVSLRYFNPIGAHESGLIYENPKVAPENLMPHVINAIKNKVPLKVFGGDYNTPDGTAIRDYIDVNDLADAHVKSLSIIEKEPIQFINIGNGNGYSVLEIINGFKNLGYDVPYEICSRRDGDIEKIYADVSLAKEKLNWQPTRNLSESLLSLVKSNNL